MSGWTRSSRSEMIPSGLNIQYSVGLKKNFDTLNGLHCYQSYEDVSIAFK